MTHCKERYMDNTISLGQGGRWCLSWKVSWSLRKTVVMGLMQGCNVGSGTTGGSTQTSVPCTQSS